MKTIEKPENKKLYDIIIDKALDKEDDMIMFPEKIEEARKTIEKIGLPGDKKGNHSR